MIYWLKGNELRSSTRNCAILALLAVFAAPCHSQTPLTGSGPGGIIRIFNTDLAVLEIQDPRNDLPCRVVPSKPLLGFDLKFHAGYEVTVPMRDLAGSENLLTILFRVTPLSRKEEVSYFVHRVRVPAIEEEAKGEAALQGSFDLGEGQYHVDWLMRDRSERVCSFYWDAEASLGPRDKQMALAILENTVRASELEQFKEEPPVERAQGEAPFNVKVLMNFAPQDARSAALPPADTSALVSILRSISREPRIGKFSLVAFNLHEQKVVFRQTDVDKLDFPALGEAVNSLKFGTVSVATLGQKNSDADFLAGLIRREMTSSEGHTDAVIFAGPKTLLESKVEQDSLQEVGEIDYPVFYMNYNLYPQQVPWKDAISHAVKFFKGQEYTISRPRDLWVAVSEMVGRIAQAKSARRAAASATQ
jgi:hypothetical protein